MNKKLVAALSGGAALLLALSGCGTGNDQVDAYAKKVCDQVQPQLKKINDANKSITSTAADGKPADIKKADSAAFQKISSAYAAMGDSVDKAGVPPVDGGEQTQKEAVKELDQTAAAYAQLKKSVDQLNIKDQAKFADGLKAVAGQLDKVNKIGDDAIKKLQSGQVGQAMAKQPGCQKAGNATPTKTS